VLESQAAGKWYRFQQQIFSNSPNKSVKDGEGTSGHGGKKKERWFAQAGVSIKASGIKRISHVHRFCLRTFMNSEVRNLVSTFSSLWSLFQLFELFYKGGATSKSFWH
jgi:hypothetical protein